MTRNDEILQKAHELAKRAHISVGTLPMSTLVAVAVDAATWSDKTFIQKACEYLYEYNRNQAKYGAKATLSIKEFTINVDEFRKAMEK